MEKLSRGGPEPACPKGMPAAPEARCAVHGNHAWCPPSCVKSRSGESKKIGERGEFLINQSIINNSSFGT